MEKKLDFGWMFGAASVIERKKQKITSSFTAPSLILCGVSSSGDSLSYGLS